VGFSEVGLFSARFFSALDAIGFFFFFFLIKQTKAEISKKERENEFVEKCEMDEDAWPINFFFFFFVCK
jgi:hypothetical protein